MYVRAQPWPLAAFFCFHGARVARRIAASPLLCLCNDDRRQGGATITGRTYFARRTSHAEGSDYMYFDVVSEFAPASENQFRIAVTYRDTGTAQWRLQYSTPTVAIKDAPSVSNTNSNTLKTAIFTLSDASFRGALPSGMDFRIYNGGTSDVTVRMVRVIRGGP